MLLVKLQGAFFFKKKLKNVKNIKKILIQKKDELINSHNIHIEYLELRNVRNLKLSNKIKNSKIFISYYLKKVRLIDNF